MTSTIGTEAASLATDGSLIGRSQRSCRVFGVPGPAWESTINIHHPIILSPSCKRGVFVQRNHRCQRRATWYGLPIVILGPMLPALGFLLDVLLHLGHDAL